MLTFDAGYNRAATNEGLLRMWNVIGFLGVFVGVIATCATVRAEPSDDLVQVKLLADTSAIKPGEPFTVGVNLKIAPAWHVYWINPGDAGEATRVTWTLPPGFTVSELKFPVPE